MAVLREIFFFATVGASTLWVLVTLSGGSL
jgi:hypothetical protein